MQSMAKVDRQSRTGSVVMNQAVTLRKLCCCAWQPVGRRQHRSERQPAERPCQADRRRSPTRRTSRSSRMRGADERRQGRANLADVVKALNAQAQPAGSACNPAGDEAAGALRADLEII